MTEALPPLPDDVVDTLNGLHSGFDAALGLTFLRASYEEVVAEVTIGPRHLQVYGLVHGGVYATIVETLASTGAALTAMARGQHTVGLDNSTSFLRATREGKLTGRAVPRVRGRRTQVWDVTIVDDAGRDVATGRVRTLCLDPGAAVAGQPVALTATPPK